MTVFNLEGICRDTGNTWVPEKMACRVRDTRDSWGRPITILMDDTGSFLSPPNHPSHKYGYAAGVEHGQGYQEYGSIDHLHEEAQKKNLQEVLAITNRIFDEWKQNKLPEDHQAVQQWEAYVYAYFKNCYSRDGIERDTNKQIIVEKQPNNWTKNYPETWTTKPQPPEHHLAVLAIRENYPEHKPRVDLINTPPTWGKSEYPEVV